MAVCLLAALGPGTSSLASASEPGPTGVNAPADENTSERKAKRSCDAGACYYGDPKHWKNPAHVDPDSVYAEISEYQEILEKKLEPDDAKYQLLMNKASRRFVAAIKASAAAGGYDLVARTGAVKGVENVPDITSDVIDRL